VSLAALKELMVLRLLTDHPSHGYALSEALEAGLGWTLGLTRPTVYAVLRRLDERGWIAWEGEREGRYPERQVYRVTAEGRTGYRALLERAARAGGASQQPLAALLLHADALPDDLRERCIARLHGERSALKRVLDAFPEHDGAAGVALDLMRRQVDAELESLEAVRRLASAADERAG